MLKMGVIGAEPLLERWGRKTSVPWARDTVLVEESDEGAQTLGRLGKVPGTVSWESGEIAL